MVLTIKRFKNIEDGTIGEFALVDQYRILMQGNTLEAAGPDTIEPNKDRRIPKGEYQVLWYDSPRMKERLPLLYNELVPKSRAILIHRGNFPKDTEGCILLGDGYDDKGVYNSKNTMNRFMGFVKDREFTVVIKDAI
jgi:hypothetical protein